MPMDKVLAGVVPVNSTARPPSKRTTKQDAQLRHSAPSKAHKQSATKSLSFSHIHISRDLIESQLLLGLGQFHPNNENGISTDQLLEDAEVLTNNLSPEPSVLTAREVFGDSRSHTQKLKAVNKDLKYLKSPSDFYAAIPSTASSSAVQPDGINQIRLPFAFYKDAKDNPSPTGAGIDHTVSVSLETFPTNIWRNIAVDRTFNRNKALAYSQYLKYISEILEEHLEAGADFNTKYDNWKLQRDICVSTVQLAKEQSSWDVALTASDLREIERQETYALRDKTMEATIAEQVALQVKAALSSIKSS